MRFREKVQTLSPEQKETLKERIERSGGEYGVYPLSAEQERMWYLYQLDRKNAYYNMVFAAELLMEMDEEAVKSAVDRLADGMEIIKTSVVSLQGKVYQCVDTAEEIRIRREIIGPEALLSKPAELERRMLREKEIPFDLERELPFRFTLAVFPDNSKTLIVTAHHMFMDAWSVGNFCKHFSAALRNDAALSAAQYSDYALWQKGRDIRSDRDYWARRLQGADFSPLLPIDRPHPAAETFEGALFQLQWSSEESREISAFAKSQKTSAYSVLLSAFYVLLYQLTGRENLVLGSPVRNRPEPRFEDTVGCFANTLPYRCDINQRESMEQIVRQVSSAVREGLQHQGLPFDQIVELFPEARNGALNPLFQVVFAYQSKQLFGQGQEKEAVRLHMPETENKVQFDMICTVRDSETGFDFGLSYKKSLFRPETIRDMAELYRKLVLQLVRQPGAAIETIPAELPESLMPYTAKAAKRIEKELEEEKALQQRFTFRCKCCPTGEWIYLFYCGNDKLSEEEIQEKCDAHQCRVVPVRLHSLPRDNGDIDTAKLRETAGEIHRDLAAARRQYGLESFRPEERIEIEHDTGERRQLHIRSLSAGKQEKEKAEAQLPVSGPPSYLSGGPLEETALQTLPELLLKIEDAHAEKGIVTIMHGGVKRRMTYRQLQAAAKTAAANLQGMGVQKGDHIVLQISELAAFIPVFWGCVLAGAIPSPIGIPVGSRYNRNDPAVTRLRNVLEILEPVRVIAGQKEYAGLCEIEDMLPAKAVIVAENLLLGTPEDYREPQTDEADIALILFTSGSTGMPKGVQLSHRNVIKRSQSLSDFMGLDSGEVTLNWMPLDHVGGIVMFHLIDVYNRVEQVQVETSEILRDPLNWLVYMSDYQVTCTWAPNFAYGLVAEQKARIETLDVSLRHLKFIENGGEAIHYQSCRDFMEILSAKGLAAEAMVPAWGMTETTSGILLSKQFGSILYKGSVAVGEPIKGVEAKVTAPNGEIVPRGEEGKLWIRGETINRGYYRNDAANEKSFSGDGWFDTGDLARIIDDEVVITGRDKDLIIINGVNISNQEIEKKLEELDGVLTGAIACCPVSNDENKDEAYIFYVRTDHASSDMHQIISDQLTRHFGFTYSCIVPMEESQMPRTSIGKIEKKKLLEKLESGELQGIMRTDEEKMYDWFSEDSWVERPLSLQQEEKQEGVLLFADSAASAGELETLLRRRAGYGVVPLDGARGEKRQAGQLFFLCRDRADDYKWLFRQIPEHAGEIRQVVQIVSVENPPEAGFTQLAAPVLKAIQEVTAHGLARFEKQVQFTLVMVCANALSENICHLVEGYAATIPYEHPHVKVKLVTCDDAGEVSGIIDRELGAENMQTEKITSVRYRGRTRYVRERRPLHTAESVPGRAFQKGGAYAVIGGLGGIGQHLCKYMLESYGCRITVVGRSGLETNGVRKKAFEQLAESGEIAYRQVRENDPLSLAQCLTETAEQYGKLDGIVNLAGEEGSRQHWEAVERHYIANQNQAYIENALTGRLSVMEGIERFLTGRTGISVTVVTSVTAFLGGISYSVYSAVNSFLYWYRLRGEGNSYFVAATSKWPGIGMLEGESRDQSLVAQSQGYDLLTGITGLASLELLLSRGMNRAAVGVNLNAYGISQFIAVRETCRGLKAAVTLSQESGRDPFSYTGETATVNFVPKQAKGPESAVFDDLLEKVLAVWREVLGTDRLTARSKFFESGGNSLKSIYLMDKINEALGLELSVVDLFQYSSAGELAAYIAGIREEPAESPEEEMLVFDI